MSFIEVTNATPQKVTNYGYLYVFTCIKNGKIPFYQASTKFVKNPLNMGPKNTYMYFKQKDAITSLNYKIGNDLDWAIERAKATADQRRKEIQESEERARQKEQERGEPANPEWISNLIKEKKRQWAEEDQKNNWYNSAKSFAKRMLPQKDKNKK